MLYAEAKALHGVSIVLQMVLLRTFVCVLMQRLEANSA